MRSADTYVVHMTEDFYELLGLSPSADPDAVRAAYRQQMTLYHPDKVAALGDELKKVAEARSKSINTAYAILSDPASRRLYDRQRQQSQAETPARPGAAQSPRPQAGQHSSPPRSPPTRRGRFDKRVILALGVLAFLVLLIVAHLAADLSGAPELNIQIILLVPLICCFSWFSVMLSKTRRWRAGGFGLRLASYGVRALLILLSVFFVSFALALWGRPQISDHEISSFAEGVIFGLSFLLFLQASVPGAFYHVLGWIKPWR